MCKLAIKYNINYIQSWVTTKTTTITIITKKMTQRADAVKDGHAAIARITAVLLTNITRGETRYKEYANEKKPYADAGHALPCIPAYVSTKERRH